MRRNLRADFVVKTLVALQARIAERFPGAGLAAVAQDLVEVARTTADRARAVSRPYVLLRGAIALMSAAGIAIGAWALSHVRWQNLLEGDFLDASQSLESVINLLLLLTAGVWFLMSLEQRLKRGRVLKDLHELRAFAHVIDMHQLTKDPTVILSRGPSTQSSPTREMTRFQLTRYLEYCAEMLALIGKLAALYGERTPDTEVLATVNDVEELSTSLGRKIWQKITILSALEDDAQSGA
ncbi:MAG: hypothetical protein K1X35_11385 [Caulobacteraceae bacterium]|nr:hypothetical protein [Caulobacteraceae bacterium]